MRNIVKNTRGVLLFSLLTLNTVVSIVPLFVLAVFKLLLPIAVVRRRLTRGLTAIGEWWIATNTLIFRTFGSIDWRARGIDNLRRDGWYLIVANHQTWVDIVALQGMFNRRVPFLKFFIKQELVWFPLLGFAWWALDMPFMKRYSASYLAQNPHMKGKDLETTRKACEKFRDVPTSVLNFVEGTRFSELKRQQRKSPYKHLLQPRAGGLAVAIGSMGELFTSVVDATLIYPDGPVSFWELCCGTPARCEMHVREIALPEWLVAGDYENDRAFRKRMHAWIGEIWAQKDAIIDAGGKQDGFDGQ